MDFLYQIWQSTGIAQISLLQAIMLIICSFLLYLAVVKKFEPLLLLPIGFSGLLSNIPAAGLAEPGGVLYQFYEIGILSGIFPLLIFLGVGAMTDFGPLIAKPITVLLGAAAQIGIFITLIGAVLLSQFDILQFSLKDAAAIGIIGGADGPTAIYLASRLSPDLLGAIAVAAYSYMALVPLIQPPIMRLLTSHQERCIEMQQLKQVGKFERVLFPLILLILVALLLPSATPLLGMFCLGNFMRESNIVNRLTETTKDSLINIVTLLLGLAVGTKLQADVFLNLETLGILLLGVCAFSVGTACGILIAKLLNVFLQQPINPLIGAAGVSAIPMAARTVNTVGLSANPHNFLLMHAMGPSVAGVIGSAIAAGIMLQFLQ